MKPVSHRPTNRKRANLRKVGKSLSFNSTLPSRSDPTRTHSIRRPFLQEIRRRYALLKGRLVHLIVDENSFSLAGNYDPSQLRDKNGQWLSAGGNKAGILGRLFGMLSAAPKPSAENVGKELRRLDEGKDYTSYKLVKVPLSNVHPTEGAETKFDSKHEEYTQVYKQMPHEMAPPAVLKVGDHYLVYDGHHRFNAAEAAGTKDIWVVVLHGNKWQEQYAGRVQEYLDRDTSRKSRQVSNAFCPTGPGGGVDPSCSSSTGVLAKLGAAGKWIKAQTKALYQKMEARYGRKTAIAIFVAGHAVGLATPLVILPGSTLLGMAPFAAVAEVIRGVKKLVSNEQVSPLLVQELLDELHRIGKEASSRFPTTNANPDQPRDDHGRFISDPDRSWSDRGTFHGMLRHSPEEVKTGLHVIEPYVYHVTDQKTAEIQKHLTAVYQDGGYQISEREMPPERVEDRTYTHGTSRVISDISDIRPGGPQGQFGENEYNAIYLAQKDQEDSGSQWGSNVHEARLSPDTKLAKSEQEVQDVHRRHPSKSRQEALEAEGYHGVAKLDPRGDVWELALFQNRLVHNADFSFQTHPDQLASFQEWLRTQIDSVGLTDEQLWSRYVEAGYKRGAGRAFDDTRPRGYHRTQETDEFYQGGRDEFLRGLTQPVAVEKVKLLASRTFADIKNVTHDLATRMGRVLVDGLVTGQSPRAVARTLSSELDFSRHRALTVARSELIRAHAEGQLDSFQRLGVQELGVEVEWSASGRPEMCEECAELDGTIMTLDQARGMIPRHPNCKCAWVPSIKVPKPTRNIFNPDQPRDDHGRWTDTGSSSSSAAAIHKSALKALEHVVAGITSRKELEAKGITDHTLANLVKAGHLQVGKQGKAKVFSITDSGRALVTDVPVPKPETPPIPQPEPPTPPPQPKVPELPTLVPKSVGSNLRESPISSPGEMRAALDNYTRGDEIHKEFMARSEAITTRTSDLGWAKDQAAIKWTRAVDKVMEIDRKWVDTDINDKKAVSRLNKEHDEALAKTKELQKEHERLKAEHTKAVGEERDQLHQILKDLIAPAGTQTQHLQLQLSDTLKADIHGDAATSIINGRNFWESLAHDSSRSWECGVHYEPGTRSEHHGAKSFPNDPTKFGLVTMGNTDTGTVVHEFGHSFEEKMPGAYQASINFREMRAGSETPTQLKSLPGGSGYEDWEKGVKDSFDKHWIGTSAYYVGKHYSHRSTEVLTMGMQQLHDRPAKLAQNDPEFFKFLCGVLDGTFRSKTR